MSEKNPRKIEETLPAIPQSKSNFCLNCEHPLDPEDKFCRICGQKTEPTRLSFKDMLDELFSSLISYDSKLHRTLLALCLKPGKITEEYIRGKRARYTNPFRFLLSLSILYFLIFTSQNNLSNLDYNLRLDKKLSEQEQRVIDSINKSENLKLPMSFTGKETALVFPDTINKSRMERISAKSKYFYKAMMRGKHFDYTQTKDSLQLASNWENRFSYNLGQSFFHVVKQPGTFMNQVISRVPFLLFLFMPCFALFIWLFYIRHDFNYMDHLIFGFHTLTMLFLLLLIGSLIELIINIDFEFFMILGFGFYLYKAMRRFYGQGRLKTIVKFTALNTIFFILASIIITAYLVGSVAMY
ncbi:DUF3667 domain-containing protein [Robertkochia solimangrovi]|uniref:DUF3667 domain-containing protein n=1 Tax=Robertkochia solimangrovi TaxID=2213046 RepID=UPI00117EC03B|nr:DUF3667 domain-containing protein [Robertkochia solimangrovi]TRZ41394.1 hypothetical protein DMZ48_17060 [Robertkochia solimangrovi]